MDVCLSLVAVVSPVIYRIAIVVPSSTDAGSTLVVPVGIARKLEGAGDVKRMAR